MTHITRSILDNEIADLNSDVVKMASMVDEAIGNAVEALTTSNIDLANEVTAGDAEINNLRFQIEEKAYVILATQQPAARDLRTVIAAIHFAVELERIGDHAAGIARIVTRLEGVPVTVDEIVIVETAEEGEVEIPHLNLSRLPKMSKRARDMLSRAIDAYINRDVEYAYAIVKRDQKIDRHYRKFFAEAMASLSSQSIAELPTYLLWIAHDLERIGDRATNLAERVIFMVTGQYTEVLEDFE
ncbi:MAG: phosphate signaling complex protein PhoU [Chloroflexota bacterium]|jgi:phosphate transport system protein